MKRGKIEAIYSVYQPIIELRTAKIFAYEALSRGKGKWRLPEGIFRRSYEQGFTIALDLECLWHSLQILPKLGKNKLLFVNIEPMTLEHAFAKGVEGDFILRKVSSHTHQMVFELTEGMKGRDFELIKKGVWFLKKRGCRFAIDDVAGIGSKLFHFLSLKPDFLKIDISLMRGLVKNRIHQDLVQRIVALGKRSGALLIAEGLERKEDVDFAFQMGIPYAQGFYFARPRMHLLKDKS